nr:hypothetical protein CFP56_49182 [Quercus suber]
MNVNLSIFGFGSGGKEIDPPQDIPLRHLTRVDGYVKIFPKVAHGWTLMFSVEDVAAVNSAEEAHQDLLEWFAKYVK